MPIAFASRTLNEAEKRYSTLEKEALAIVWGTKKLYQYIEGRTFKLLYDHQPLSSIFNQKSGIPQTTTARIQRWAIFLSGLTFSIEYIKSESNGNADALCRLPLGDQTGFSNSVDIAMINNIASFSESLTLRDIEDETKVDPVLSKVLKSSLSG
ncbi:Retrovirus-related Pol polyprotein from transposon 17.6 [Thelohanellus kitauei]|uniref:Retrovirus-related Pol polyprotein from transposon 17.6 n=1 Tax=Thelohanellus kitauei TaxID=669202 RepID=A0A0C2I6G4_THEKT|nr:Retrovirus-related Pol polyprotein from transposon 17.6 [Thelohanellus kitauei]